MRTCFLLLSLSCALFAQEELGTIRGRIVDATTGQPLANRQVVFKSSRATTDDDGRFEIDDALPGRGLIRINLSDEYAGDASRTVTVAPGETLVTEMRVHPGQSISGRITDENDEPMPSVEVVLIGREYYMGELRYYRRSQAVTDEHGRYKLRRELTPGAGWLVWAHTRNPRMPAISDEPVDPALRRPAFTPTFYPNALRAAEATVIPLKAGEQRQDIDIRMRRSPSLCAEAQVELLHETEETTFWIEGGDSLFRMGALGGTSGAPSGGTVAADGRLRICGLTRGAYRLSVYAGNLNAPSSFGATDFAMADEDVAGIQIHSRPRVNLPGRVIWAANEPQAPVAGQVSVYLTAMDRSAAHIGGRALLTIPGEFQLENNTPFYQAPAGTLLGDYAVALYNLPRPVYIRDILYGSTSVLHRPLALGSELAGSELRIVVEHDGGMVKARATDEDGEPVADASVVTVPNGAATHMQLAETRVVGTTDQNGEYTTPALAAGEYFVMALEGDFSDLSPETIGTLFDARSKAKEVNIAPNATVEIGLEVRGLAR